MKDFVPFFPLAIFDKDEKQAIQTAAWYSSHLYAMQEPSLWFNAENEQRQRYRFLWLRTFHQPIAVRLSITDDGQGEIVLKVTDGMGGYGSGKLVVNESQPVTKDSVTGFLSKLQSLNFWELPTSEKGLGCDGAQWILEGVRDGKYHLVDRWSPKKGKFRKTALALIGLSNLTVENIY